MATHIYQLSDAQLARPSMVTIGVFDGVHLGHQALICRLVQEARATGRESVLLTFFPHPDVVLGRVSGRYYLTSPEERAALLHELGVDLVVTHPFDDTVRQIRAADFVDQLLDHLHMRALWVGANFAMGYKREGNVEYLQAQGHAKGFEVQAVELFVMDGDNHDPSPISSARIRDALAAGQVAQAANWLGHPYRLSGEVVRGDQRGRTIGFPTANIAVWDEKLLPARGVYACWAYLGDERHLAVTNVGIRPTFVGDAVVIEAHLLDFDRDIYGAELHVDFVARLRSEQKFSGIDALVAQIRKDEQAGRKLLTGLLDRE